MDSFEFSKIAGAVLAALLVIFGFKTFLDGRLGGHGEGAGHEAKVGYTLPSSAPANPVAKSEGETKAAATAPTSTSADATKPEGEAKAAAPAAPAPAAPAPAPAAVAGGYAAAKVVSMIAAAKPENGQGTFRKCLACHTADKASASKAGPNLWNVVGRKKGTREDFSGYSEAMKVMGGEWTLQDLADFLHSPKGWLPGTKMIFPGVADPADVADLLAYMRTLADSPAPLPN